MSTSGRDTPSNGVLCARRTAGATPFTQLVSPFVVRAIPSPGGPSANSRHVTRPQHPTSPRAFAGGRDDGDRLVGDRGRFSVRGQGGGRSCVERAALDCDWAG